MKLQFLHLVPWELWGCWGSMCRGAAGRCLFLETPELEQLRPLIPGFQAWQVSGCRWCAGGCAILISYDYTKGCRFWKWRWIYTIAGSLEDSTALLWLKPTGLGFFNAGRRRKRTPLLRQRLGGKLMTWMNIRQYDCAKSTAHISNMSCSLCVDSTDGTSVLRVL